MIVLHYQQKLIFTPSKTGSSSLHEALTKLDGGRWLISDTHWQHISYAPKQFASYERFLLVRNPYERFKSIWGHYQRDRMAAKQPYGTIEELAERLAANDYGNGDGLDDLDDWFFGNITDFYGDCGYEFFWQLEHIDDCLSAAGIPVWMPHINRNTFAKKELSQEVVKILGPWAEPDCTNFGYEFRG